MNPISIDLAKMHEGASHYSLEDKRTALELSNVAGPAVAAEITGIPLATIGSWRKRLARANGIPPSSARWRKYTEEQKTAAIEYANIHGLNAAARKYGIRRGTLGVLYANSRLPEEKRKVTRYTYEFRQAVLEELTKTNAIQIADKYGIDERTVRYWQHQKFLREGESRRIRRYDEEFKAAALTSVAAVGFSGTLARFDVGIAALRRWASKAGVKPPTAKGSNVANDIKLLWVLRDYPELSEWREFAVEWLSSQARSLGQCLHAMSAFFKQLIAPRPEYWDPKEFLHRRTPTIDFFAVACPQTKQGANYTKTISRFIQSTLLRHFSERDDFDRPVVSPLFHNPVDVKSQRGLSSTQESVYSPLPYGYIDQLRRLLIEGPSFRDWKWAQELFLRDDVGRQAPDWFVVEESQIDRTDPDCVWRRRLVGKKAGGWRYEMWSPVRWVAMAIKLILPLRTFQIRMLDSGEADTWRFDGIDATPQWAKSTREMAQGTLRNPHQQGVFRRAPMNRIDDISSQTGTTTLLYVNTNKTGDIGKAGAHLGYTLPWASTPDFTSDPIFWLLKLRNWQEKYNPIHSRTSWTQLDGRHINAKSEQVLSTYPDACFLFRLAELSEPERNLPIGEGILDVIWHALLSRFEALLEGRNETHADGSPIVLVPDRREQGLIKSGQSNRTFFPLHSLRVSLITALALDGQLPFPVLQKIVGHSRLLMTLYYTKVGEMRTKKALEEGLERLEKAKDASIVAFLRETEHTELLQKIICNSAVSVARVLPVHSASRNAAGWMPMHHGLCLAGGNASASPGTNDINGCFNGGPLIASNQYAPVPNGARNCVRCRWFVTSAHHLPALVAHFNNIAYHFDEARAQCLRNEKLLDELKNEKYEAEQSREIFTKISLLKEKERVWEGAMQRFSDFAEDLAACYSLILKCVRAGNSSSGASIIDSATTSLAIQIDDESSELSQVATICRDVEIYPDLNAGKAVFRRSQILDMALHREGMPPMFMTLSEEDQLKAGNAFVANLAKAYNPSNLEFSRNQIIKLVDAGASLSASLGINVDDALARHCQYA